MTNQGASITHFFDSQGVIPRRAVDANNWRFKPQTDGPGYQASFFPAYAQTENYFSLIEPSKRNGGREQPTQREGAFYGCFRYPTEALNQNQTNVPTMNVLDMTRMAGWKGQKQIRSERFIVPHNPKWWLNYNGSQSRLG